MARKVLQVVASAYRCTLEEQDDPVLWMAAMLSGAGADTDVLLRGNAVSYAIKGQDASGLTFGDRTQTQPPRLDQDVEALVGRGVAVYLVQDDAGERGIGPAELVAGVQSIARHELPRLFADYDQIWHW